MKTFYKDISSGSTASIEVKKDGTAILRTYVAGKRTKKTYKNKKSAYAAWYRMTA